VNPRVLARAEAQQMALDLGDVIGTIISLAAEGSDSDKAFALDALVTLQTKRNVLETAIRDADRECQCVAGAERDLETLRKAAGQREGGVS
jgi:hypothetical protein